jgi:hypothetical protein
MPSCCKYYTQCQYESIYKQGREIEHGNKVVTFRRMKMLQEWKAMLRKGACGSLVVKALGYKAEGRGFENRPY